MMPLPHKALLVTLVLNSIFNELALAHLVWAGQGHLPSDAIWLLALLYSMPSTIGFFSMQAVMAKRVCRRSLSLPLWSGLPGLSFGLSYNLLAPTLVAFLAWGTAV